MYFNERSRCHKFKDFGHAEYSGDCFFFVGKIFALACEQRKEFLRIMEIIDHELRLGLDQEVERVIRNKKEQVIKASKLPSIHDGFETAKSDFPSPPANLILMSCSSGQVRHQYRDPKSLPCRSRGILQRHGQERKKLWVHFHPKTTHLWLSGTAFHKAVPAILRT